MESITYKRYTINIELDKFAPNPRELEDNMGIMVCFHRKYNLGDKTDLTSDMFSGWDELYNYLKKELKAIVILPLYLYDHSMQSISCGNFIGRAQHAEWDSEQVGFIYTTKEKVREFFGNKKLTKKQIEKDLQAEVEIYDVWIRGGVCCFNIEDENGCAIDDGAVGGFYNGKDAIAEAKSIIDYEVKERNKIIPKGCLIC